MKILATVPMYAAAAVFVAHAAAARAAENVLDNGGFEQGTMHWQPDAKHELVRESAIAHTGTTCLTGEVTVSNNALRLVRHVEVQATNRYQFEIWAKATNRTKLVLWAVLPGDKQRRMIASWLAVPSNWQRYSVPIDVGRDGTLKLEAIAPSSFGEPPGRIWVDDVALYATSIPPAVSVSKDVGFNDEPTMALAADGSVYIAWNSFRDGADSLQMVRMTLVEGTLKPAGSWQIAGGRGMYQLGPCVVRAEEGVTLLYAVERESNWDIYALPCGPEAPGKEIRISTDAGVDVKPAAAWHDGTLQVAWESNRNGARQIFAASVRDAKVSEPAAVSSPSFCSYGPTLAVLPNGETAAAWHSFQQGNYDIYMARRQPEGPWTKEIRLTKAPTIDRHPVLATRDHELWIAYENAQVTRYHVGTTNQRRLYVARIAPEGLMEPITEGPAPLDSRCEAGTPVFDEHGRLWLSFLRPRLPRAGWDVFLTRLDGNRWQPAESVSPLKGMDRRPALAVVGGRAIIAFQADNIPNSWSTVDRTKDAGSNILLAALEAPKPQPNLAISLRPLTEPADPFAPAEIRVQRGEDIPIPSIAYNGQKLNVYFGDLHEHSDISVCNRVGDQSVDESYQHMRDIARYDFVCVTDHGYNMNPYLWSYSAKLARTNDDAGRFLTFLGHEWTSSFEETSDAHPHGYYGHRNLILGDMYFNKWWNARNGQTPTQLWDELRRMDADFVHIPHQLADTGNVPTDWKFVDEQAQPVAEIFQTRGSYEYLGCPRQAPRSVPTPGNYLQDAWADGIVIGVIAAPDHGGGYGKACVFAPELSRKAILDALRARRAYGTTAAKIFLDVRVNGHLMGEKIAAPAGEKVDVKIVARCPAEIEKVEVCRNNVFIHKYEPDGNHAELTFVDREPPQGFSWYYVRLIQKDEEIAWSSPVWFGMD